MRVAMCVQLDSCIKRSIGVRAPPSHQPFFVSEHAIISNVEVNHPVYLALECGVMVTAYEMQYW